jgi:hypothetical protein
VEGSQVSVPRAGCHFLHQNFSFDAGLRDRELSRQSSDRHGGHRERIRSLFTMRAILPIRLIIEPYLDRVALDVLADAGE